MGYYQVEGKKRKGHFASFILEASVGMQVVVSPSNEVLCTPMILDFTWPKLSHYTVFPVPESKQERAHMYDAS